MKPAPSDDVVQYLKSIGWSEDDIDKMARGPSYHSEDEIAAPRVSGVVQLEPPMTGLPRAQTAGELSQKTIVDAIWANLHGDPSKILLVLEDISGLSGPQQAYLVAAWMHVQDAMGSLQAWREHFHSSRDERRRTESKAARVMDHVAVATLEGAAQAQNDIPFVGEDLRNLLEVGIEIREALMWSLPQPLSELGQLSDREEAKGAFRGIEGQPSDILDDPVAKMLPVPEAGIRYPFVPSLGRYSAAAERLHLYPHQANTIAPPRLRFRWSIRLGKGGATGSVFLGLHGVEATLPELEIVSGVGTETTLTGYLTVSEDIGDLLTGTLRVDDVRGWNIETVRIARGSDGMQWEAGNIGLPDLDGHFRLLKLVELDERADRDWLVEEESTADATEDGEEVAGGRAEPQDSPSENDGSKDKTNDNRNSERSATDGSGDGEFSDKRRRSATKGDLMKKFEVVGTNADGTYTVREVDSTALAPMNNNVPSLGGPQGFQARVGGRIVTFASEQDYREAEMAWREMNMPELGGRMGTGSMSNMSNMGMMGGMMNRGSGGAGFLRTGADAAEAVTGFFAGRNLRQKRDDLLSAMDAETAARDKIGQLSGKYGDLVSAILDWIAAEQQVNATAVSVIDDQIFALDMQAGVGVVRTMSDLWDGYNRNSGGGDGAFGALAVGAVGLGIGFLLSNSSGRAGRRGRRF